MNPKLGSSLSCLTKSIHDETPADIDDVLLSQVVSPQTPIVDWNRCWFNWCSARVVWLSAKARIDREDARRMIPIIRCFGGWWYVGMFVCDICKWYVMQKAFSKKRLQAYRDLYFISKHSLKGWTSFLSSFAFSFNVFDWWNSLLKEMARMIGEPILLKYKQNENNDISLLTRYR